MKIVVNNPVLSTWIFITVFLVTLLIFRSSKKQDGILSNSTTQELKGFAILAIIFSHIGYFLVEGDTFLFPISIFAGVGVNLFLFLSGYGLTMSSLKKDESIWQFYNRRLPKLYIPFWIVLIIFILLDYFVLKISYSSKYLVQAFSGIFLKADMFTDLNSNFWYMTLILSYYVLFPIFYMKKYPWITATLLFAFTYKIVYLNPILFKNVDELYKVHLVAFPLGIIIAWLFTNTTLKTRLAKYFVFLKQKPVSFKTITRYSIMAVLLGLVAYGGYYSGVGETIIKEQTIGIFVMLGIVLIFILKRTQFNLFYVFGIYSYPIYLIHWPIMSRYDFLFAKTPAWFAVLIYMSFFLGLGWILQKIQEKYF